MMSSTKQARRFVREKEGKATEEAEGDQRAAFQAKGSGPRNYKETEHMTVRTDGREE